MQLTIGKKIPVLNKIYILRCATEITWIIEIICKCYKKYV